MTDSPAQVAVSLAERLPPGDLRRLADAAAAGQDAVRELRASAAAPTLRDACDHLVRAWTDQTKPAWVAGALTGAAAAVERAGRQQRIDIVWTGPESAMDTGRLTAPTVVDLIGAARSEILLVSYAARHDDRIAAALAAAAVRKVAVTVLLERHADNPAYTAADSLFADLGVRRLAWPGPRRPRGAALHAKLIVVDRHTALVGSANLTGRAMADNLECGVLLRGRPEVATIVDHIESLLFQGTLDAV